jgi:hypothetical protein
MEWGDKILIKNLIEIEMLKECRDMNELKMIEYNKYFI